MFQVLKNKTAFCWLLLLTFYSAGTFHQKDHFFKSKKRYFLSGTLGSDIVRHFGYSD